MEKFNTVVNIAKKQTNLGVGLGALLTAGGEQIFSSVVFECPCSELNFLYGLVFLLVPALALLLLGYILNKRTWKLLTGVCSRGAKCTWRKVVAAGLVLLQISCTALVAPNSWIAVALLSGKYYECAMTGTNVSTFNKHLCENKTPQCEKQLLSLPCRKHGTLSQAEGGDILLLLRAQSQILGWLLIASIMLSSLVLTCVARCTSPISYLQLKFWKAYVQEESDQMDSYTTKHAKDLAERNLTSFFKQTPPANVTTPSNKDWEKISALYKFSTKDQYYSTLHQYVEHHHVSDDGLMRMVSVKSSESTDNNPAVLTFVDEGPSTM